MICPRCGTPGEELLAVSLTCQDRICADCAKREAWRVEADIAQFSRDCWADQQEGLCVPQAERMLDLAASNPDELFQWLTTLQPNPAAVLFVLSRGVGEAAKEAFGPDSQWQMRALAAVAMAQESPPEAMQFAVAALNRDTAMVEGFIGAIMEAKDTDRFWGAMEALVVMFHVVEHALEEQDE